MLSFIYLSVIVKSFFFAYMKRRHQPVGRGATAAGECTDTLHHCIDIHTRSHGKLAYPECVSVAQLTINSTRNRIQSLQSSRMSEKVSSTANVFKNCTSNNYMYYTAHWENGGRRGTRHVTCRQGVQNYSYKVTHTRTHTMV